MSVPDDPEQLKRLYLPPTDEFVLVDVPAGGKTALEPGGLHVMLIGLKAPLKEGDKFPLTLTFAKAGKVDVEVIVEKPGAATGHH